MLIINKKRIYFILIVLIVSVINFSIFSRTENTIQTVSLPVSNKTVVLDAGHGLPDEGGRLLKSEKVAYIRYFKK